MSNMWFVILLLITAALQLLQLAIIEYINYRKEVKHEKVSNRQT